MYLSGALFTQNGSIMWIFKVSDPVGVYFILFERFRILTYNPGEI